MFDQYRKSPLFRSGSRISAVLALISTIVWGLWPENWANFEPSAVPALVAALLFWIGVEVTHFIIDAQPLEHPSDKELAREINKIFPEGREAFFRTHSVYDAFHIDHLNATVHLSYFDGEDRREFVGRDIDIEFRKFIDLCKSWSDRVGRYGGVFRENRYIVMSDEDYEKRDDFFAIPKYIREHVSEIDRLGILVANGRMELGRVFRDKLPSIYET